VKNKMVFEPQAPCLKGIVQIKTQDKTFKKIGDASLWKFNKTAEPDENAKPTFKGTININGQEYKISLWDN
jgi:hypothetical protein